VEIRYFDFKLAEKPCRVATEKIVAGFEKAFPNIKVKLEEAAWADFYKKLVIMVQGGTPPDVTRTGVDALASLCDMGALEPNRDWLRQNGGEDILTRIPPAIRNGLRFENEDYNFSTHFTLDALTWNKALFERAGLDPDRPPQNWDEFVATATKLTDPAKDQYGFGLISERSSSTSRRALQWMLSAGAELFTPDRTELALNSDAGARGFQFWVDLARKHRVTPPGYTNFKWKDVLTGYGQGKIAMFEAPPHGAMLVEPEFPGIVQKSNLGPLPSPWRPPLGMVGHAVLSGTSHKEEAFLFAKWLASADAAVEFGRGAYYAPLRSDAREDPRIVTEKLLAQEGQLADVAIPSQTGHPKWPQIEDKFLDAISGALSGARTPKQALEEFVRAGNAILKQA
jgi:ABC-type glycerol-3-phosphate transport system substrate-binding protein